MEDNTQKFLDHLHEEKLQTQAARTTYTLQKLAFVTGLMGLGSLNLKVGEIDFSLLLYLAPWVAIAFDFNIMGEDYSIKRIGAFLKENSSAPTEMRWEKWVAKHRDPFVPWSMPILTTLIFAGAALIALQQPNIGQEPLFIVWLVVTGLPSWLSFAFYHWLRQKRLKDAVESANEAPITLSDIAVAVRAADYQLTETTYHKILEIFLAGQATPAHLQAIRQAVLEYGEQEFLVCVNKQGEPINISVRVIEDFREKAERYPEYRMWFREATAANGQPTLLIARWLCHSVGFRHRVIHLFLDHPTRKDCTLLQVRAFDKAESPGRFDLPVAGHVSAQKTIETTLRQELSEELGLAIEDLGDCIQLGSYVYVDPSKFCNVEHRTVLYGRLHTDDWLRLTVDSPEVAAVVSISVPKLHEMLATFPEGAASGLRASFPLYLGYKVKL